MPLGETNKPSGKPNRRAALDRRPHPNIRGADKLEVKPGSIGTLQKKGTANKERAKQVAAERKAALRTEKINKQLAQGTAIIDPDFKVQLTSTDNLTPDEIKQLNSQGNGITTEKKPALSIKQKFQSLVARSGRSRLGGIMRGMQPMGVVLDGKQMQASQNARDQRRARRTRPCPFPYKFASYKGGRMRR